MGLKAWKHWYEYYLFSQFFIYSAARTMLQGRNLNNWQQFKSKIVENISDIIMMIINTCIISFTLYIKNKIHIQNYLVRSWF